MRGRFGNEFGRRHDPRHHLPPHVGDPAEHLRDALHAHGGPPLPPFPPGPWPGPGGGFGFGFGPPGPGRHGHRRGRGPGGGRRRRGDVRAAILTLLAERPMHGYEMIQEITERSGRFWKPSPGSVYPTLQLLADEGLISTEEGRGGKRLYQLTEDGQAAAAKLDGTPPWEQIAQDVDPHDVRLRDAIGQLMGATVQVAQAASESQKTRAVDVLKEARRELYAILGEAEPPPVEDDEPDEDDTDD
jgi:DNA-binding PadR family transcriptional regulator